MEGQLQVQVAGGSKIITPAQDVVNASEYKVAFFIDPADNKIKAKKPDGTVVTFKAGADDVVMQ